MSSDILGDANIFWQRELYLQKFATDTIMLLQRLRFITSSTPKPHSVATVHSDLTLDIDVLCKMFNFKQQWFIVDLNIALFAKLLGHVY